MKPFQGISLWRCRFPLRLSFRHSRAERLHVDTLIVCLRAKTGRTGHGQALPRAYLTGESLDGVEDDIRKRWWPRLRDVDFPPGGGLSAILAALAPLYREADSTRALSAYACLEAAALDALLGPGEAGREPPAGGEKNGGAVPFVGVVPACGPRRAYWTARALRILGYRHFKVKVGLDRAGDTARLAAVRRAAGTNAWLAADANGVWDWDTAVERMRELAAFGVELVEEPLVKEALASGTHSDYRELARATGVEVMADESICTIADAHRLLSRGSPGWWNLRAGKNGGANGMLALARLAREHAVRLYGGVLVGETSAMAAAGRLGMGVVGAQYCEYGFPRVLLKGDPFRGGPGGFAGNVSFSPPAGPGLGVRAVPDGLARVGRMVWEDRG